MIVDLRTPHAAWLLLLSGLSGCSRPPASSVSGGYFHRGVNFTAERGVRYDTAEAREMLERLPEWGINTVALVPYGFARRNPVRVVVSSRHSWENDEGMERLAAAARAKGMKVFLKPHVWRGPEMDLTDPEELQEWFRQYAAFLDHYAGFAAKIQADLFCVGVELKSFTKYEARWRGLIARVRAIYKGPLVYAANHGPEFETIAFWDALDYIGLDNYYPLPDDLSTAALGRKIEAVRAKFRKPVLFTEAGFSAIEHAHRAPWEDETDKPLSLAAQASAYEALLKGFYDKEWFHGVYWWKVGTNGYGGPENNSMTPWEKPAMEILKRWYTSGKR